MSSIGKQPIPRHVIAPLKRHWLRLANEPPAGWPGKIIRFGLRQIRELTEEALTRLRLINPIPEQLDAALVESLREGQVPQSLEETLRKRFFISPDQRETILTSLREVAPEAERLIIAEADRICDHVFDLLGSGPTPLGGKIDWHVDFKTGHRWNPKTYYKRIRPAPYPGGYDIKVPWELSRCQHFVRLGQAYWITGDEKYAREFVAQVEDWMESNPWPFGVNWACTMEVAIRAVNWLWGLAFFVHSPSVTDEFLLRMARSLLIHGRHIMNNLEGSREDNHTTNHYIADLVGLVYLGICCPFFREAQRWLEFGTSELWNEMFKQVYPDGVDYEGSIPYHRLVTEMFLSAILLCQRNGVEVPQAVMERMEKMLEFIYYVTKPDGTVPIIGDQDNGRLHRLAVWGEPEREWADYRYLLAIGAGLVGRQDFAWAANRQYQEAIWLCREEVLNRQYLRLHDVPRLVYPKLRSFEDAGLHVIRTGSMYVVVNAGRVGTSGKGNHSHSDSLSFELAFGKRDYICDSATFVYTADWNARNEFRSVLYHNMIAIDRSDRRSFRIDDLFSMSEENAPYLISKADDGARAWLAVQHNWRAHTGNEVMQRRVFVCDGNINALAVIDVVVSSRSCDISSRLHFASGVSLKLLKQDTTFCVAFDEERAVSLFTLASVPFLCKVDKGWISPAYGVRCERPILVHLCKQVNYCALVYLIAALSSHPALIHRLQTIAETPATWAKACPDSVDYQSLVVLLSNLLTVLAS